MIRMEEKQTQGLSKTLDVNTLFWIPKIICISSIQKLTKDTSLVTLLLAKHIGGTINPQVVKKSMHVTFDESNVLLVNFEDFTDHSIKGEFHQGKVMKKLTPTRRGGFKPSKRNGNQTKITLRTKYSLFLRNVCANLSFISQTESKSFKEVEIDGYQKATMQDELQKFERSKGLGTGPLIGKSLRHRDKIVRQK